MQANAHTYTIQSESQTERERESALCEIPFLLNMRIDRETQQPNQTLSESFVKLIFSEKERDDVYCMWMDLFLLATLLLLLHYYYFLLKSFITFFLCFF
jgi:hypothetical protein